MNKKYFILVGVLGILLVAAGAACTAAEPYAAPTDGMLRACVKGNGQMRLVSNEAECKEQETYLSWDTEGQPGPKGDTGDTGATGVAGIQGPAGLGTPAYDSGWVSPQNDKISLSHHLGGDMSKYFVDLQCQNMGDIYSTWMFDTPATGPYPTGYSGAWYKLTPSEITISRLTSNCIVVRARIWLIP